MSLFSNIKKIIFLTEANKGIKIYIIFLFLTLIALLEVFSISLIFPIFASILDNNFLNNLPFDSEKVIRFIPKEWINENNIIVISPEELLIKSGAILLFLFLAKFILIIGIYSQLEEITKKIKNRICDKFYIKYLKLPYVNHFKIKTSEIVNNLMRLYEIPTALVPIAIIFIESLTFILISVILFFTDFNSAVLLFFLFPLVTLLITKINKTKLIKWSKEKHKINFLRLKSIQDLFKSVKDVKITQNFQKFLNDFSYHTKNHTKIIKKERVINFYPRYILEIVFLLTTLLVFYFLLINSDNVLDIIPKLSLFTIAGLRLIPSVSKIITNYNSIKNTSYIVDLFYNLSFEFEKIKREDNKKVIKFDSEKFYNLNLKDISYRYPNKKSFVLENINLCINKKESIGIIGESGIGKSTLLDLAAGLIHPVNGQIQINDVSLSKINNLSELIGYVPQEVNIISDSLRENIALGIESKKIDDNLVNMALEKANLKDMINKLPKGLDSLLGESGKLISGGEKQRIGIARALYNNPKILLLDESTSSLDDETATKIIQEIVSLSDQTTVIMVTHKKQNLDGFSRIFELKKRLIELK